MSKLAVLHPQHKAWVPALRQAAPSLDIRGWHPEDQALDLPWLADCEALFTGKIPVGFLKHMPALRWIQNGGAGVDHLVNHPELPPEVTITRADGQFGVRLARYVSAHFLSETQGLTACREAQDQHRWESQLLPEDLWGAKALVLGFGRIGRRIGETLRLLGMEVTGFVRNPRPDPDFELLPADRLGERLPQARLLVIAVPLTPETRGIVDRRLLAHGHARLTLINIGRGDHVVIPDLLEALDQGNLGRAVLDVVPQEPLPPDSPLWDHPKVTLSPHHAGPSAPRDFIPDILPNLQRYAEGLPIQGGVDRALGY